MGGSGTDRSAVRLTPSALAGWSSGLAAALTAMDPQAVAEGLASGLASLAPSALVSACFFRRDAPPIYVRWVDAQQVQDYVSGYYLLDPLYELFLRQDTSACLPLKDIFLPELRGTGLFRDIYRSRLWTDDVTFLVYVRPGLAAFVSLIRNAEEALFTPAEHAVLASVLSAVEAVMVRAWSMVDPAEGPGGERSRRAHRDLAEVVQTFGADVLTARECEVMNLLVKGFAPKAVARILAISPGTVRNHTKHIYVKLGVHSRSELMALFLEDFDAAMARTERT